MKKRAFLTVLVFALTICNSYEIASAKKIMAHYMPWYQSQPVSGFWGWHWHMSHAFDPPTTFASHYTPLFGLYDSSDPHVLASQALLMKFGGIDGIIADWYGIECLWDYCLIKDATELFIPYVKEAGLEFSICYEDRTLKYLLDNDYFADRAGAVAHGAEVMEWLEDNYFIDPCYTKIDDKPVLLNFGPNYLYYSSDWTTLFAGLSPKPHFFPYRNNYVAARTGGFDWPVPQSGTVTGNLDNFYYWAQSWAHYIAGAFPRFHDIYEEAGMSGYPDIDATGSYGSYGTSTYHYTLERALESDADIIQLVTWNDYGEGTIIEPTEEDGYTFLEMTQDLRKEYIDTNFSYVAADLRLPVRLYTLRKGNLSNPTVMAQLDTVEDYLFANNLSGAKNLLDQIECTKLAALTLAWLSSPGNDNWNPYCDTSQPPDNIINFIDFTVFAENWLTSTP